MAPILLALAIIAIGVVLIWRVRRLHFARSSVLNINNVDSFTSNQLLDFLEQRPDSGALYEFRRKLPELATADDDLNALQN